MAVLSNTELRSSFPGITPGFVYTSALVYGIPTLEYLQGPFYDYWIHTLGGLNLWTSKWECWDFTSSYLVELAKANALTPATPTGETTLSVGRWDFHPEAERLAGNPTGHSIIAAITDQGLRYLDPQNNTLWSPSSNELASTRLLLF